MSFEDKVVIVTGASSGIGAAVAIKFASEGAKVVLVGRNENKLRDVSEQCEAVGVKPFTIVADITEDENARNIINETISNYGGLDILINNAGKIGNAHILDENHMAVFDDIMSINLRSVVYLTYLAAPHLVQSKGSIINMSSIAATCVLSRNMSAYGASKAAMDNFSKYIALELADKGVRVNTINPGPVKTDIFINMGLSKEYSDKMFELTAKLTPLGRYSASEEIADLVLYLSSDKAVGITGATFVTDNGKLLTGINDFMSSNN